MKRAYRRRPPVTVAGPDPVDVHAGRRLKEARLLAGLSQTKLAAKLRITFQQVQKYEKGVNRISASMLWRVALATGHEPQYFFDGLKRDGAEGVPQLEITTRQTLSLVKAYEALPDDEARERVRKVIEAWASAATAPKGKRRTAVP